MLRNIPAAFARPCTKLNEKQLSHDCMASLGSGICDARWMLECNRQQNCCSALTKTHLRVHLVGEDGCWKAAYTGCAHPKPLRW
jgi:hypothetical protein